MSHFAVMVVGNDVEKHLQPFHEFECTGRADEYVQTIDETEAMHARWLEDETRVYVLASGVELHGSDDQLYRDPTPGEASKVGPGMGFGGGISYYSKDWGDGRGYRPKVFDPSHIGATEKVVKSCDAVSFRQFVEDYTGRPVLAPKDGAPSLDGAHKYGWIQVDADGQVVRVVDRTNPNAKWGWWVVGGRWSDFLPNKHGGKADQLRWGDVDVKRAQREAVADAERLWALWQPCLDEQDGVEPITWGSLLAKVDAKEITFNEARNTYDNQPCLVAAREHLDLGWNALSDLGTDRDAYIRERRSSALLTFAVLKDGVWHERGKMGWFGMAANKKDRMTWGQQVEALLEGLDPDTLITIVDCHI